MAGGGLFWLWQRSNTSAGGYPGVHQFSDYEAEDGSPFKRKKHRTRKEAREARRQEELNDEEELLLLGLFDD